MLHTTRHTVGPFLQAPLLHQSNARLPSEDLREDAEMRAKAGHGCCSGLLSTALMSVVVSLRLCYTTSTHSLLCPQEAKFSEQETPQAGSNPSDFP